MDGVIVIYEWRNYDEWTYDRDEIGMESNEKTKMEDTMCRCD
jgi:hypothetical protein